MQRGRLFSLVLAGALAGAGVAGALFFHFTRSGTGRLIDPDDIVQMSRIYNPVKPENVMFVETTLTSEKDEEAELGNIKVFYSRLGYYRFSNQSQYKNIKDLLNAYIEEDYEIEWKVPDFYNAGKANYLSLESRKSQYIVIILKCANCRFVRKEIPFRIEGGKEDFHVNPRVAWKNNSGVFMHEEEPDERADATIGYFIARSDRDHAANGNFRSSFNIYLELKDQRGDVPISVDPDVGFPGGNR